MKSFGFIANVFHEMAAWIQALAEAEAERASSDFSQNSSIVTGAGQNGHGSGLEAAAAAGTNSGSSFLTGGIGGLARRMGGGFGSSGLTVKQRGLPELVGLPDFFHPATHSICSPVAGAWRGSWLLSWQVTSLQSATITCLSRLVVTVDTQ